MAMRKVTVEINEETYARLEKTAKEAGLSGVESYVSSLLADEADMHTEVYDFLFTPERLEIIDRASMQVKEGRVTSLQDVENRHQTDRLDWIEKNSQ